MLAPDAGRPPVVEQDARGTGARVQVAYGDAPAAELLRAEAARFHGVPEAAVLLAHDCPRCGGTDHGRPSLLATAGLRRPAHVSLARAAGLSVVALSTAGPVGVDVEPDGAAAFPGFHGVAAHPDEAREDPTRIWVRKEALLKAHGTGLAVDPRDVAVDAHGLTRWDAPGPAPEGVWLRDLDVAGHAAAVVVLLGGAPDQPSLTVRGAAPG